MNLVIDVGNSRTKIAWFEKGEMVDIYLIANSGIKDIQRGLAAKTTEKVMLSSVGIIPRVILNYLSEKHINYIMLDSKTPIPLKLKYGTPETLGHDRIAAAVGAYTIYPDRNVLIIDMGTAITFDIISDSGEYLGGNISPGMALRFKSLHEHTARLPLIEGDANFPEIGRDTKSALVAGVQNGILHELEGYIKYFEQNYPNEGIILTGGDADFFVNKLKRTIFVIPNLVLIGLNYILDYNALQN